MTTDPEGCRPEIMGEAAPPAVVRQRWLPVLVRGALRQELQPLPPPRVDSDFARMGRVARVLESIRYAVSLAEYRIGRSGWLRAWLATTAGGFLLLAVPLLAAAGLVWLAVPLAGGTAALAAALEGTAKGLFTTACYAAKTVLLVAAVGVGLSVLGRAWRR